ncbi:hypothetical protein Selin_2558 [Desulfurispirillum indicum S5]|uniref:Uncharacterized protein n=1 Tax=Desulfurispirillum indicum (strain ATCC BAA-1389 / DSM 22839 / S5) TaxID=653733 RepID=E6W6D5_DESIS|nr:hypothetical protein [Desulfurispirillum indicum]ADU67270.1 hypothetical protein Selin_2558 [Desulfurispirillum indicum S5]
MGQVRAEVNDGLLFDHPEHRDFLIPFLNGFFVTWGRRRREYNTELFVYFLSPEDHFKESYGFENEVLLVYAPYDRMEPRTFQAVEQILATSPAKGRVETLSYFLITDVEDIEEWMESYISSRQESRVVIPFHRELLVRAKQSGDDWFVRNSLDKHFFGRDLFNYSLPLIDDAYFFGRQNLLMDYYDSIKQSENRAIFGLRKTGKTSFLYKLKRLCESERSAFVFYYDCKVPHIRKSKWNEFLCDIANDIAIKSGITIEDDYSERSASRDFEKLIRNVYEYGEKIVLMLDEIEYVSFVSPKNRHWADDYIDFWQTMWSCDGRKTQSFEEIFLAGANELCMLLESAMEELGDNPGITEEIRAAVAAFPEVLGEQYKEIGQQLDAEPEISVKNFDQVTGLGPKVLKNIKPPGVLLKIWDLVQERLAVEEIEFDVLWLEAFPV